MTPAHKTLLKRYGLSALMGALGGFFSIFIGFFTGSLMLYIGTSSDEFGSISDFAQNFEKAFMGHVLISIALSTISVPLGALLGVLFFSSIAKKTLHIPYKMILHYAGTYAFWATAFALMIPVVNYILLGTFTIIIVAYVGFMFGVKKLEQHYEPN